MLLLSLLLLVLLLLFTEFAQPGVVHVGVQLARSDSPLFPKFRIRVRSPLESILDVVPHTHASAPSSTALLAAVVAYLGHCDDKELEELDMKMDGTLVNILRSALPHVADWKLSYDMKKVAQTLERLQVCAIVYEWQWNSFAQS